MIVDIYDDISMINRNNTTLDNVFECVSGIVNTNSYYWNPPRRVLLECRLEKFLFRCFIIFYTCNISCALSTERATCFSSQVNFLHCYTSKYKLDENKPKNRQLWSNQADSVRSHILESILMIVDGFMEEHRTRKYEEIFSISLCDSVGLKKFRFLEVKVNW
jgi:hypothetical protein